MGPHRDIGHRETFHRDIAIITMGAVVVKAVGILPPLLHNNNNPVFTSPLIPINAHRLGTVHLSSVISV
jgi:hypothetical protein